MSLFSVVLWTGWFLLLGSSLAAFAGWKLAEYLDEHPELIDKWLAYGKGLLRR